MSVRQTRKTACQGRDETHPEAREVVDVYLEGGSLHLGCTGDLRHSQKNVISIQGQHIPFISGWYINLESFLDGLGCLCSRRCVT